MGFGFQGLKNAGSSIAQIIAGLVGQDIVARSFSASQAAGSDAFKALVNGARFHFGTGANDYASSDGTTVTFAGPLVGAAGVTGNVSGLTGGAPANSTQLTLTDTTNSKSVAISINNTVTSFFTNGIAAWVTDTTGAIAFDNKVTLTSYTDDSATPGNRTVNKVRGKNAIALGASTCVVTNSFVTTNSQVICTLEANDATATFIKSVVPSGTGFTITVNANATAALKFSWTVIN